MKFSRELRKIAEVIDEAICEDFVSFQMVGNTGDVYFLRNVETGKEPKVIDNFSNNDYWDAFAGNDEHVIENDFDWKKIGDEMPMISFRLEKMSVRDQKLHVITGPSISNLAIQMDNIIFDIFEEHGEKVNVGNFYDQDFYTKVLMESQKIAINSKRGPCTAILTPFKFEPDYKIMKDRYVDCGRKNIVMTFKGITCYDAAIVVVPTSLTEKSDFGRVTEVSMSFYAIPVNVDKYARILIT